MLSPEDTETLKDVVHAIVDEDYRRLGIHPFNITRLKARAVHYGMISEDIARDPSADAVVETTLDEIVSQDIARGDVHRIVSVEPIIPGERLWQYQ